MNPWLFSLVAVASLFSLRVYIPLFREALAGAPVAGAGAPPYKWPDAVFGGLLALFFLASFAAGGDRQQTVTAEILINGCLFYSLLVAAVAGFLLARGLDPARLFGLAPGNLSALAAKSVFWLVAAWPAIMLAQMLSYLVFPQDAAAQGVVRFLVEHTRWQDRGAVVLLAVAVAPLAEETLFRGYLYGLARQYAGRLPAIVTTSMLFSAIHGHAPSFAGLFLLGVALAVVYEKTGTLWVPLLMHSLFNAASVAMAVLWPDLVP